LNGSTAWGSFVNSKLRRQLVEEASAHELDYTDVVVGQCERDSLRRLKPGKSVV